MADDTQAGTLQAGIAVVKPEFSLGTTAKDTASRGSHVKITLASMADNKALETALSNCLKGEKNQKEAWMGCRSRSMENRRTQSSAI